MTFIPLSREAGRACLALFWFSGTVGLLDQLEEWQVIAAAEAALQSDHAAA